MSSDKTEAAPKAQTKEEWHAAMQKERRARCLNEVNAFLDELEKGEVKPVELLILFQNENNSFGFRSNDGPAAAQIFMLRCTETVILSQALTPAQQGAGAAGPESIQHPAGHA